MKVDKAVCTSNDAYFSGNTTANELSSIIKFETVFTTLVENKILAIKRECEQHESKKKSRTLKGILNKKPVDESQNSDCETKKKTRKSFFLRHKNKHLADVDVEKGGEVKATQNAEIVKVEVQNEVQGLETNTASLDSQQNVNLPVNDALEKAAEDGPTICDNSIVHSQTKKAQLSLSTTNSSNVNSNKTIKELSPTSLSPPQNDESLATTIDISLQQQSSVVQQAKALPINNNDKSDVAICDDVSSQNTSDIEFSLVSESICELPTNAPKKISTNSDPILVKKPAHFLSPPLTREVRVTERKAISCQSTPLFGRHNNKSEGEVKKVLTFQKELPKKVSETTKTIEKVKSQTIVIAPNSTTTTTTLAKPSGPVETVHVSKKAQKHSKYRDVSVEYEISYDDDDGNQSPRGFLSSFNQLTSQIPPAAVITSTNPKKQSMKQAKIHDKTKEAKCQQETGSSADGKTAKHRDIELELDDLADDVVNKKKKRRSKYEF